MPIRYKLLLAFGAIAILVGGLAFYGVRQISSTGALVLKLYDGPLISVNYTRSAHAKFNHARALTERALSLPDDVVETVKALEVSVTDLLEDLGVARGRTADAEIIAALDKANELILDWHQTGLLILRPRGKGLTELPMLTSVSVKADAAAAAIDDAVELAAARGFEFRSAADAQVNAASSNMIALALGATLFAVAFSLIFSYSISRPIREAMAVAARVAAGDFTDSIKTVRRDEMGALLRSLKQMQTGLRGKAALEQSLAEAKDRAYTKEVALKNSELRRNRVFLDSIVENIPAMLFVKDARDRRFVLLNRAGEETLGVSRDTIIGKNDHDLLPKEEADLSFARDSEILQAGELHVTEEEKIHTTRHGTRFLKTKKIAIPDDQGKPQYLLGVSEDITDIKSATARIAYMAHHDSLTELPNRAAFNERLEFTMSRAASTGGSFAVMSIDLDRFKEVNDVYGHSTGDALLRDVARRLQAAAEGAFVSRVGGDEFMIISENGSQPAAAIALADRLQATVAGSLEIYGHFLQIGISAGIAIFPDDESDLSALLANADAALYRAKADGRGTVRLFEAEMDASLRERRALQQELRSAIDQGELRVHYQPQARIDGGIIGFEALVRWHHPTRGLIPPNTFIPLAEESGFIIEIGEWVLREACREAASWPHQLQIAINLSPVQFRHGDIVGLVHLVLLQTGLASTRLELEITEGVLMSDSSRALSILRRLKSMGIKIAMDDFGTGYSSLSYLQSFPFDKIKIDRAFISSIEQSPQSAAIVRAVIGLGRAFNLPVVAEGVETQGQATFLVNEQCDEMQGFLIGRPAPIENYTEVVGVTDSGAVPRSGQKWAG
jgi:diguanylate cyclase (GGDEF)-like protein/PAS domain S-box-containing protein